MTLKQAIEKAIEGGWKLKHYEKYEQKPKFLVAERKANGSVLYNPYWFEMHIITTYRDNKPLTQIEMVRIELVLLDPSFWQSLGKAMGWGEEKKVGMNWVYGYIYHWHSLIDHLVDGESIESYFEKL